MAQGDFTKEEAEFVIDAFDEVMSAFPKSKAPQFLGHFNDICLFLDAAKNAAPSEQDDIVETVEPEEDE